MLKDAGRVRYSDAKPKNEIHNYGNAIRKMIDRFSEKEKDYIGDGYWIDSNHVIYRRVIGNEKYVAGFLDVYSLPKFEGQGLVIIATSKSIRGQGVGKAMASAMVEDFDKGAFGNEIKNLRWLVDADNMASESLAKSLGFVLASQNAYEAYEKEYKYFGRNVQLNDTKYELRHHGALGEVGRSPLSEQRGDAYSKRQSEIGNAGKQVSSKE